MSSSRFPGKVLESLDGQPMIVYMIMRARRASTLDDVAVITSTDPSDDVLADTLLANNVPCFRGELFDVLSRYHEAAGTFGATEVVRLTADCPLIDPALIDKVVRARRRQSADYASNVEPRTFPDGLDVESFTREALDRAHCKALGAAEREHVTLWMTRDENGLRRASVRHQIDYSSVRLTVDYPEDLIAVRRLVELVEGGPCTFGFAEIIRCMAKHPEIAQLNAVRQTSS